LGVRRPRAPSVIGNSRAIEGLSGSGSIPVKTLVAQKFLKRWDKDDSIWNLSR
jgi:hypothetical protein